MFYKEARQCIEALPIGKWTAYIHNGLLIADRSEWTAPQRNLSRRRKQRYKQTADRYYWAAGTDDHRTIMLPPTAHRPYLQLEKSYFLLQKYLGILFCENKNSLAPRWHDKFLPKPYVDIFEKTYTYDTCSSIEHYQIVCDPFEIHFMLLRSRSRTLLMLFPLLGILYIYRCCFI